MKQTTENDSGPIHNSRSVDITISDILCEHKYLDPNKAQKMKRINLVRIPRLSTVRIAINYCISLHAPKSWRQQIACSILLSDLLRYAAIVYQIYSKVLCDYSFSLFDMSQPSPIPEKLYEFEHPRYAKQFDDISLVPEDEIGYWISKKWCRGWFCIADVFHFVNLHCYSFQRLEIIEA